MTTSRPRHASCGTHPRYALSCAEYDDLLRLARGRCKICKEPADPLFIDHDHTLGDWAVRGLICHGCNLRLAKVESGRHKTTAAVSRYLANAWHKRQPSSAVKAARMRPQQDCPTCGKRTSVYPNGNLYRHWSRLPGQHNMICGAGLPQRPVGSEEQTV